MGKRTGTLLLAVLLLLCCVSGKAQAAQPEELETVIARQVEEYASSLMTEEAPVAGKNVLLRHAVFGGGKDLTVDDESQLTAAFMNSTVLRECLKDGLPGLIRSMQEANLDVIYGCGVWQGVLSRS